MMFAPTGRAELAQRRPAVFLDRDGTLNEACPDPDSGMPESPLAVADVRLLPGTAAALSGLVSAGYALVCVSNQPAAAKGKVASDQLLRVHERVIELLAGQGVELEASLLCLHHPHGVVGELSGPCPCRKPAPGMLLQAAGALALDLGFSWIIGDTDADVAAGHAAGSRAVLIEYAPSAHKRAGRSDAQLRASDVADAVACLLDQRPR